MSTRTFLSSKVFLVSCVIIAGGILPTAVSAETVASSSNVGSVLASVDLYRAKLSGYLETKKASLLQDIAELQTWEASTTQTTAGQRINEAVGDDSFVPKTRPTGTLSQTIQRIASQVLVFFIIVTLYILAHPVLMYIVIIVLVYILLRLLWRMIGRQQF